MWRPRLRQIPTAARHDEHFAELHQHDGQGFLGRGVDGGGGLGRKQEPAHRGGRDGAGGPGRALHRRVRQAGRVGPRGHPRGHGATDRHHQQGRPAPHHEHALQRARRQQPHQQQLQLQAAHQAQPSHTRFTH